MLSFMIGFLDVISARSVSETIYRKIRQFHPKTRALEACVVRILYLTIPSSSLTFGSTSAAQAKEYIEVNGMTEMLKLPSNAKLTIDLPSNGKF